MSGVYDLVGADGSMVAVALLGEDAGFGVNALVAVATAGAAP
jgi:hypothetical protein